MNTNFNPVSELIQAVKSYRERDFEKTKAICEGILAKLPDQPDALNMMALVARATKKWGKAEEIARHGIQTSPTSPSLHNTFGLIALDQHRLDEAEAAFRQAIENKPEHIEFRVNLGRVLHEIGQLEEAYDVLTSVLDDGTALPNALIMRAAISSERGDLASAKADLESAETLSPDLGDLAAGKALCAFVEGDLDSAYSHFDRAVADSTDVADARVNRGMVRLLQGRLKEGWDDYEMRYKRRWARIVRRSFPFPKWQGEDLSGKTLLLWGEQGLGEAILCSSLIPEISAEANSVVLECDSRLAPLFRRSFPNVDVREQTTQPDPEIHTMSPDYQASILDPVLYRNEDARNRVSPSAYLKPNLRHSASLRTKYQDSVTDRPLVGLSWGSPKAIGSRVKSIEPETWLPLLSVPGITFVNLQYGDVGSAMDEVVAQAGATMVTDPTIDLDGPLEGHADQIAALDLVITVSTTTAHLSGALGQQTWVMVPPLGPSGMWYWFADRDDSPWYPEARLFRRHYGKGKNAELLSAIVNEFKGWIDARSMP